MTIKEFISIANQLRGREDLWNIPILGFDAAGNGFELVVQEPELGLLKCPDREAVYVGLIPTASWYVK